MKEIPTLKPLGIVLIIFGTMIEGRDFVAWKQHYAIALAEAFERRGKPASGEEYERWLRLQYDTRAKVEAQHHD